MNPTESRFWLPYLAALLIASLGCAIENNGLNNTVGGGATNVAGTVEGQSFTVASGSAEPGLEGTYVVTLADTPEFSCTASDGLPMNYLQIVIGDVTGPGTFDADGRVFFNVYESGVSAGSGASSGSVTIDAIDTFSGEIEGSIDAQGPDSSVSGSFRVEICSN